LKQNKKLFKIKLLKNLLKTQKKLLK